MNASTVQSTPLGPGHWNHRILQHHVDPVLGITDPVIPFMFIGRIKYVFRERSNYASLAGLKLTAILLP